MTSREMTPRGPRDLTGQLYRRQAIARARQMHEAAERQRLEEIAAALDTEAAADEVTDMTGRTDDQA
jgi:hypothetical protein